jgi:D-alanyl-D-alanine carboxypeptidase
MSAADLTRTAAALAATQPSIWETAGISKPVNNLVVLPREISYSGKTIMLQASAAKGLERLLAAAARDGIRMQVVSGYRDYGHQVRLYRAAVARYGPGQKMVAKPGRSEHHMGNTVDFADGQGRHVLSKSFGSTPEGRLLRENGPKYGWHLTVHYEPWHARYFGNKSFGIRLPRFLLRDRDE